MCLNDRRHCRLSVPDTHCQTQSMQRLSLHCCHYRNSKGLLISPFIFVRPYRHGDEKWVGKCATSAWLRPKRHPQAAGRKPQAARRTRPSNANAPAPQPALVRLLLFLGRYTLVADPIELCGLLFTTFLLDSIYPPTEALPSDARFLYPSPTPTTTS